MSNTVQIYDPCQQKCWLCIFVKKKYKMTFLLYEDFNKALLPATYASPCATVLFVSLAREWSKRHLRHMSNSTCKYLAQLYSSAPDWELVDSYALKEVVVFIYKTEKKKAPCLSRDKRF